MYISIFSLLFAILRLFIKVDSRKIVFVSFQGDSFDDSPKVLYDKMLTDSRFREYNFIWAFVQPEKYKTPKGRKVRIDTPIFFFHLLSSRVWITNGNIEKSLKIKNGRTIYVNTWHSISSIKKTGNLMKNRTDYDFSDVDIMLCSTIRDREKFIKYYNVSSSCIRMFGLPRCDVLFDNAYCATRKETLRGNFLIPAGKKVILYAPTYRAADLVGDSQVPITSSLWMNELSDEYIVFVRSHHLSTSFNQLTYNDFIRNGNNPNDINDMMILSDILITDYSSVIYDYSLLRKPILLYLYDYKQYSVEWGFSFNYRDNVDLIIHTSEQELLRDIKSLDYVHESERASNIGNIIEQRIGNATLLTLDELRLKLVQGV
jgi:CDP-glycerol glycerophosphotransferase